MNSHPNPLPINRETSTTRPPQNNKPRPNLRPLTVRRAESIQRLLMKDIKDPETTPAARAQLARAWDVLEERKRVVAMVPKPKDLDVSEAIAPKKPRWGFGSLTNGEEAPPSIDVEATPLDPQK